MIRMFAVFALLFFAVFPTVLPAQSFDDEFNGFVLDSRWSWVREDRPYWSLDASKLQIMTQTGALNGTDYNDVKNILLQPAPNVPDFNFRTKIEFSPDSSLHNAGLIYRLDDDNYIRVSRGVHENINGVWMEIEQLGRTEISFVADITSSTVQLSLSRNGGTMYRAMVSPNDTDWTIIAERNTAFPSGGSPKIGLQAANGQGNVTTSRIPARFDWFHVNLTGVDDGRGLQVPSPEVHDVYPAPARAGDDMTVTYTLPGAAGSIRLSDMLGRVVWRGTLDPGEGIRHTRVPTAGVTPGTYMVTVESGTRLAQRSVVIR